MDVLKQLKAEDQVRTQSRAAYQRQEGQGKEKARLSTV